MRKDESIAASDNYLEAQPNVEIAHLTWRQGAGGEAMATKSAISSASTNSICPIVRVESLISLGPGSR